MTAPLITIFVRHSPGCKYAGDEFCKRCNCRKHFRWSLGGKQFRKQAGTRSWAEADEVKRRLEDQLAGRVPAAPTEGRTIRGAYESFLQKKKVKEISGEAYKKYEREILRFVRFAEIRGVFTLAAMDNALLEAYKATWRPLYPSSATRSLVQQLLRVFFNYCHGEGWITHVPKMDPVKIISPATTPLSAEEYARLLAVTTGQLRAIIQLMRWSGLAVRDASCLSVEGLTRRGGIYQVTTARQKTGVHVSTPIPNEAAKDILAGANKGAKYLFWYPEKATALTFAQRQSREISAAFDRARIHCEGHMVSHRLRDTFAVDLLGKGVAMEQVSKLLGHKSISTTERHYAPWAQGRQDQLNKLVIGTWGQTH